MTTYNVSFLKNDVYQSNLVKTSKSPVEIAQYFIDVKHVHEVLGINIATADDNRPGKPVLEI